MFEKVQKRHLGSGVFLLFSCFFLALALASQWKITRIAKSRCSSGEFFFFISTYSWNSHRCNDLIVNIRLCGKCPRNHIFITNMNNEHWTVQTIVAKCRFIRGKNMYIGCLPIRSNIQLYLVSIFQKVYSEKKNGFSRGFHGIQMQVCIVYISSLSICPIIYNISYISYQQYQFHFIKV